MEEIQLEVQIRKEIGKEGARLVRRQDFIPGIVYGEDRDPTAVKVDRRTFERIERQHRGESVVLHLSVLEGTNKLRDYSTIIKDIQSDPVSEDILHIDFQRINLNEEIEVNVPIHSRGEPVGVKKEGGALDHVLWELDVICLPGNIPQHLTVDVSHLSIHDVIQVKDLLLPEGVKTQHDPEAIVFSVVPPRQEESEPGAEAAEGVEPEVIREKKDEKKEKKGEKEPQTEAKPKEQAGPSETKKEG